MQTTSPTKTQQIAANLEPFFVAHGFTETSVAALQEASGVSMRTLYKYFPSKEAMIIGALNIRHDRYIQFLAEGAPNPETASPVERVLHLYKRLGDWMKTFSPTGCLYVSALASYPDHPLILGAVTNHKAEIELEFVTRSNHARCSQTLFVLHEGVAATWSRLGENALNGAMQTAKLLLEQPDTYKE